MKRLKLFDTHCHFEKADPVEIGAILARAQAAGVEALLAVGGSAELNSAAQCAASLSPIVRCALGYDREQCESARSPIAAVPRLAAWGEIGLDYHYSPETREQQRVLFAEQLEEARRRDLPVVIHTREADDDTLALLREIPSRGIIHCYTGSPEVAEDFLDLGFYISISGIVTFRGAINVRATAIFVPDDRLLIETDSPFLAPEPKRGQPNEPAFLAHTCTYIASLRGQSAEAVAALTFANAERVLS